MTNVPVPPAAASTTLSEHESKVMLARYGVPVAPEHLAATPDEAAAAAAAVGFPAVAKLCGRSISHKTERGLVRLGLPDGAAVRAAAADLLAAATDADGDVAVLVSPVLRGSRELIAGLTTDAQFGPCIMVGVGGILAEAFADVAFRLAPVDRTDAEEMFDELGARMLFGEFRGEPAVDRDRVVDILTGLSRLAGSEPDVLSVDVNPLILVDGIPVAVDGLVEVRS